MLVVVISLFLNPFFQWKTAWKCNSWLSFPVSFFFYYCLLSKSHHIKRKVKIAQTKGYIRKLPKISLKTLLDLCCWCCHRALSTSLQNRLGGWNEVDLLLFQVPNYFNTIQLFGSFVYYEVNVTSKFWPPFNLKSNFWSGNKEHFLSSANLYTKPDIL